MQMQSFIHVKVNFKKKFGSRKISPMLDDEVESRSDGKVFVLFTRDLEKVHPCWSQSDGIHRIHWKQTDSDGKVHDMFVRVLEKFIYISVNFRLRTERMSDDTCSMLVLVTTRAICLV